MFKSRQRIAPAPDQEFPEFAERKLVVFDVDHSRCVTVILPATEEMDQLVKQRAEAALEQETAHDEERNAALLREADPPLWCIGNALTVRHLSPSWSPAEGPLYVPGATSPRLSLDAFGRLLFRTPLSLLGWNWTVAAQYRTAPAAAQLPSVIRFRL